MGGDADTYVAFKKCTLFTKCITHISDEHIDTAENIDIAMPMCNLIEYGNNYSGTSGSLWDFKRDKSLVTNDINPDIVTTDSTSFKYKSSILGKSAAVSIVC